MTGVRREVAFLGALGLLALACAHGCGGPGPPDDGPGAGPEPYLAWGRFTDPGVHAPMLEALPGDFDAACEVIRNQIVHYRMLSQWGIERAEWDKLPRGGRYLFATADILSALRERDPSTLSVQRAPMDRVKGSCSNESLFLTSALRSMGIPARVRMGYFEGLYRGKDTMRFWMNVSRYERGGDDEEGMREFTEQAIRNDNRIEHWICEYWDRTQRRWRLLDVRTEYPAAYGIEVDKHLPVEYFQYAWEAWQSIGKPGFDAARYSGDAWDGDGRSHIRRQLLLDFYSLLNREAADVALDPDPQSQEWIDRQFFRRSYSDLSAEELRELDQLAERMSRQPSMEELTELYWKSRTLRLPTVERDPCSFVRR